MIFYKFTKEGAPLTKKAFMTALTAMSELGYPAPDTIWVYHNDRIDLIKEESLAWHAGAEAASVVYKRLENHTKIPTALGLSPYLIQLIKAKVIKSKAERYSELVYKEGKIIGLLVYCEGYSNLTTKRNVKVYDKELDYIKQHVGPDDKKLQKSATKTLLSA